MKTITLFILSILWVNFSFSQSESDDNLFFNGNTYNVFSLKIDKSELNYFEFLENTSFSFHNDLMTGIDNELSFFAINASITDSTCSPVGYYVNDYTQINPVNLNDGFGNFYLKPNGAFIITDNEAVVCESSKINQYNKVRLGIQSGPMLLVDKVINTQFNPASVNKNKRCGVGMYENSKGDRFLIFAMSKVPVTFYEFATLFALKYNCSNALNLESYNCVINLPDASDISEFSNMKVCNYIIYKQD